jgi:molybdate transport repressor ModE-like protein
MLTQSELLKTLAAVGEHGSITAAAMAMTMDYSTIKRRLEILQQQFPHEPLYLSHGGGGTKLTAVGDKFASRAARQSECERIREILELRRALEQQLGQLWNQF